jgi:WD40 repeat protein
MIQVNKLHTASLSLMLTITLLAGCQWSPLSNSVSERASISLSLTPVDTPTQNPPRSSRITITPTSTPTPLPTATPAIALVGTPHPQPKQQIRADNATRVTQLARWGKGIIKAASFSSDSQKLAVASSIGVYIYDINNLTEYRLFTTTVIVSSVAFAVDSLTIACGLENNTIIILDTQTGQPLRNLRGHDSLVNDLEFSSDGRMLASGSADHTVKLWNVRTGQLLHNLKVETGPVSDVAFSSDNRFIASVSGGEVRVWDTQTGRLIHALENKLYSPAVAFSPDSQVLAVVSDDALWLIDTQSGQSMPAPQKPPSAAFIAYLSDGRTLSAVSRTGDWTLWDIQTGQVLRAEKIGHVNLATHSPNGEFLASLSDEGVALWNVQSGELRHASTGYNIAPVHAVAFLPDGQTLGFFYEGEIFKLLDAQTGQTLFTVDKGPQRPIAIKSSPDGQILAYSVNESVIRLWNIRTNQFLHSLRGHTQPVTSINFSPDGQTLVSASFDGTFKFWDVRTGQLIRTLKGGRQSLISGIASVTFSPDGQIAAFTLLDGSIKLRDAKTGRILNASAINHKGLLLGISFSPNGKILASSTDDGSINLWEVPTGRFLRTLEGHTWSLGMLEFSADGRMLASSSLDGSFILWDIQTGQPSTCSGGCKVTHGALTYHQIGTCWPLHMPTARSNFGTLKPVSFCTRSPAILGLSPALTSRPTVAC